MFEASVVICLVLNMSNCMVAFDNRGPYKTEGECMDRIAEMSMSIMQTEYHVPVSYKCQKKGESATGEQPSSNNKQNIKSPA